MWDWKFNGTHQLLVYADDVNLLGDDIDTTKKSTETLTDASKKVGLEVNTEEIKYMLASRHQNAGQNHDINIVKRCFENVAQFRYLGTTITNQNPIQEEIKKRLNSGNAFCHSVQNLLPSRLLSKKRKNENIRSYNFACGSLWVWNLVSDIKGGIYR
jgi:ribosomal protein S2